MNFDFFYHIPWDGIPNYLYVTYSIFLLCTLIQLHYYLVQHRKVVRFNPNASQTSSKQLPVSVVICATNEQQNLEKNLPLFLKQDYPQFEVVVVNNCSTDESEMLLYSFKQRHSNLQVTTIEQGQKFIHDRKLAITVGLKAARYETIVFTEPDCAPDSDRWLASMQQAFGDEGEVVISYCRKQPHKGVAEKIMRCDSVFSALFSLRAAIKGVPYRGSTKNMGIRQPIFFRNNGFARYSSYLLSEETLFLCRNANRQNTRVTLAHDAILSSDQRLTFGQWFRQKCTYTSLLNTGKRGRKRIYVEMLSRVLFHLCIVALACVAALRQEYLTLVGVAAAPLLLLRFTAKVTILVGAAKKLRERGLVGWLLLYDIFSPLLAFVVSLAQPNLQKLKKIK
ncbi:MAG: glycosyltransferase [Prevotellaceae bacterium]|jgi:glycosyltransferase involved in cell wall biosynthesis|nr:glycosyltransferase [Prevotellaceae bacterium]